MKFICTILIVFLSLPLLLKAETDETQLSQQVLEKAKDLLKTGMNTGGVYEEVWIRDLNTFIVPLLEVAPPGEVKTALLHFFHFQGEDGNCVDGYVHKERATLKYDYLQSSTRPQLRAHKNTVETDQESSLVQAVCRYVEVTGDRAFLREKVKGTAVLERLERALEYPLEERFSERYKLLWGATTADWGDVQPEDPWGVKFGEKSHRAVDIYDNALYLLAIQSFLNVLPDEQLGLEQKWISIARSLRQQIRKHLWDEQGQQFIPHHYLEESPFPTDFDEKRIFAHGGTAVAIQAGLLSRNEILTVYGQMKANLRLSGAATLGLTLYPSYPAGYFLNPDMGEYSYQNGGDWTWFGARMVTALAQYGFVEEARRELRPMLERVIKEDGFYEWWSLDNQPHGSGEFRGSAGVLIEAIEALRAASR